MRKLFLLILLIAGVTASAPPTDPVDERKCSIKNDAFKDGEVLVYKLYYNWKLIWIPAGEVTFEVRESANHYEYFAKGITYPSYDNFFKVRDYYYSRVNRETLFPTNFVRNIQEGKYTRYDSIVFDQEKQEATSFWGSKMENARPFDYDLSYCMQDMLSILYYVRNYDYSNFQVGDDIPISVFFDKEEYPLKVRYNGKERKKKIKGQGKFKTMKFTPEVVAGYVFDENTTMKLWVSDDENKIPLLIESPVSIGSIKAVLKKHENLKFELSSKISD